MRRLTLEAHWENCVLIFLSLFFCLSRLFSTPVGVDVCERAIQVLRQKCSSSGGVFRVIVAPYEVPYCPPNSLLSLWFATLCVVVAGHLPQGRDTARTAPNEQTQGPVSGENRAMTNIPRRPWGATPRRYWLLVPL